MKYYMKRKTLIVGVNNVTATKKFGKNEEFVYILICSIAEIMEQVPEKINHSGGMSILSFKPFSAFACLKVRLITRFQRSDDIFGTN